MKRDGLLIQTQETMTARYLRRGPGKTTEGEQQSGTAASDLEIILIPLGFLVICLLLYCWRKKYNASFERALQASIQLRRTNENKEKLNQLKDKLIKKVCLFYVMRKHICNMIFSHSKSILLQETQGCFERRKPVHRSLSRRHW